MNYLNDSNRKLKRIIMGLVKEFREFALKGNIIDLAVALVIGAAFGAIISSLVDDVITPLLLTPALDAIGASDISALKWGAVKYGNFLAAVIKFIMVALVLFGVIKAVNRMKRKEKPVPVESSSTDKLLMEIRDALRK